MKILENFSSCLCCFFSFTWKMGGSSEEVTQTTAFFKSQGTRVILGHVWKRIFFKNVKQKLMLEQQTNSKEIHDQFNRGLHDYEAVTLLTVLMQLALQDKWRLRRSRRQKFQVRKIPWGLVGENCSGRQLRPSQSQEFSKCWTAESNIFLPEGYLVQVPMVSSRISERKNRPQAMKFKQ